jgi:hypothetical protein
MLTPNIGIKTELRLLSKRRQFKTTVNNLQGIGKLISRKNK